MTSTPDSDTTYLYLVRHAATDANRARPHVLQGNGIDFPLNELGRRQAEAVGRFLADFVVQRVFSSPLLRAMETANAIAAHHGRAVAEVAEIVEADVGDWEGKDWGTIMRDYPAEYRDFMQDPGRHPYLNGESYGDVQQRIGPKLAELLEAHRGESIVVVAHNVVNRVYLAGLLGLDLKFAKGIRQTNTGVNLIRRRGPETELITLNACFHLDGIGTT